jgi:hypothetical protein
MKKLSLLLFTFFSILTHAQSLPWVKKLPPFAIASNRAGSIFIPGQLVIALEMSASNQKMFSGLCVLGNKVETVGLYEYGKWSLKGCLKLYPQKKYYQSFVPILRKLRPYLDEEYQPQDTYLFSLTEKFFPNSVKIDYRVYLFETFIKFSLGGENQEIALIPLEKETKIELITRSGETQEEIFSINSLAFDWLSKLLKE